MKDLIISKITDMILTIRNVRVMVDKDLALLYGIETKRLNEQVKRNIKRFPEEFMFQLTKEEKDKLVANCDRFNNLKHSSSLPYVFAEQGVAMLSSVLNSDTAIQINIQIIKTFIKLRDMVSNPQHTIKRLNVVETKLLEHDHNFNKIFNLLENKQNKKQGIFFEGQLFDSYKFISDLIRSAKKTIVLIDNYIDDRTLNLFTKRKKNVKVIIYTKNITKNLKYDLNKYNEQYVPIEIKEFNLSHDRFLIIDEVVYHIGASLKDLGNKWCAFSKFEKEAVEMLKRLR